MDERKEVGDDPTQRLAGDHDRKGVGYVFGVWCGWQAPFCANHHKHI